MSTIIGINNRDYQAYRKAWSRGKYNGAYYYAKEIEENIIPLVETDYNWDLLGVRMTGHMDHSIIFIHHCLDWDNVYGWLENYKDIILVVSTKPTLEWAKSKGYKAIFLPLSIDVEYVKKFKCKKKFGACYAGNRWAFKKEQEEKNIPKGIDYPPENIPREDLLRFIAPYRQLYAVGRCALEGMVLGCEIKPFLMDRYPDPSYWKVLDNKEAAVILQEELNKITAQPHESRRKARPSRESQTSEQGPLGRLLHRSKQPRDPKPRRAQQESRTRRKQAPAKAKAGSRRAKSH